MRRKHAMHRFLCRKAVRLFQNERLRVRTHRGDTPARPAWHEWSDHWGATARVALVGESQPRRLRRTQAAQPPVTLERNLARFSELAGVRRAHLFSGLTVNMQLLAWPTVVHCREPLGVRWRAGPAPCGTHGSAAQKKSHQSDSCLIAQRQRQSGALRLVWPRSFEGESRSSQCWSYDGRVKSCT